MICTLTTCHGAISAGEKAGRRRGSTSQVRYKLRRRICLLTRTNLEVGINCLIVADPTAQDQP